MNKNCNTDELLNDMQETYHNMDQLLHKDSLKVDADTQTFYKLQKDVKQVLYPKMQKFN